MNSKDILHELRNLYYDINVREFDDEELDKYYTISHCMAYDAENESGYRKMNI